MNNRIIAIGDIHGCYYTLINLLDKIKYNKEYDIIIFLGDYIDRGKHSYEVVSYLCSLQRDVGIDRCICLVGNHEDMAVNDKLLWNYCGSRSTKKSYYSNGKYYNYHFWWFNTLPVFYEINNIIFCHAGLTYEKIEDNAREDLIWESDWIKLNKNIDKKLVVFGHTPSRDFKHYITKNGSICIDTGCVYGGNLCAMIINDGEINYVYEPKSILD